MADSSGSFWTCIKSASNKWVEDDSPRLAAALSYYAVFSFGPLLVLATGLVGLVFGEEAARGALARELTGAIGPSGAEAVQALVASASGGKAILASLTGLFGLLLGASGVFVELKGALNLIWKVSPRKVSGIMGFVQDRLMSLLMVAGIGIVLLASVVMSTVVSAFGSWAPGVLNFVASFAIITFLFAMIFRILPETHVPWADTWKGAAMTSVLFALGKFAIGLYLGRASATSAFGASASLVVVMLWAYYSSMILYWGAEFTYVYAHGCGSRCSRVEPGSAPEGVHQIRPRVLKEVR